jgi:hypothetical protein
VTRSVIRIPLDSNWLTGFLQLRLTFNTGVFENKRNGRVITVLSLGFRRVQFAVPIESGSKLAFIGV